MDVQLGPTGLIRAVTTSGALAVNAGARVVTQHIRSQTRLKFGLYALAALFVVVAAFLVVFAPDGRQTISSIVAVALVVLAVGCAGFGTFAIKTAAVSVEAGMDDAPATNGRRRSKPLPPHLNDCA
jgi:protein-S-isoprenylcysteine O-methyltransferase Ste14